MANTTSASFTWLSKYDLFELKYSVKREGVNVRTAACLLDLTSPGGVAEAPCYELLLHCTLVFRHTRPR